MFAREATDYFGGDIGASLFLHTWSLGVEEQFYLVWPFLFLGRAWRAARAAAGCGRCARVSAWFPDLAPGSA